MLKNKPKKEILLIIGSSALILTHSVIAMYTAILCLIYVVFQMKALKEKQVKRKITFSFLCILLITSFFFVPLLEHKQATNYEVFQPGRMERIDSLIAYKLSFSELFFKSNNRGMIYEIGWINIILLVLSPIVIKKFRTKWRNTAFYRFYKFSLISGLVCIVMTLKIFPFEYLPSILKMLQFPFRMLEFSSFFLCFVVSVNFCMLVKKVRYRDIIIVSILLIIISSVFVFYFPTGNIIDENKLIEGVRVTPKTGRVHAGCASFEYLPTKAFKNRNYIETRKNEIIVLQGNAKIEDYSKENTNLNCTIISNGTDEVKIELPYIYYLGYEVSLDNNSEKVKLDTYETDNGFVGVTLPKIEVGKLDVHYEGTVLMKVSFGFSVFGVLVLIVYCVHIKR